MSGIEIIQDIVSLVNLYKLQQVRTYWIGYPTKQPLAARNLLLSPFHEDTSRQGAFYGVSGGVEAPRFYMPEFGEDLRVPEYDW